MKSLEEMKQLFNESNQHQPLELDEELVLRTQIAEGVTAFHEVIELFGEGMVADGAKLVMIQQLRMLATIAALREQLKGQQH